MSVWSTKAAILIGGLTLVGALTRDWDENAQPPTAGTPATADCPTPPASSSATLTVDQTAAPTCGLK